MSSKADEFKLHIILVFSFICLGSVIYGLTQTVTALCRGKVCNCS